MRPGLSNSAGFLDSKRWLKGGTCWRVLEEVVIFVPLAKSFPGSGPFHGSLVGIPGQNRVGREDPVEASEKDGRRVVLCPKDPRLLIPGT